MKPNIVATVQDIPLAQRREALLGSVKPHRCRHLCLSEQSHGAVLNFVNQENSSSTQVAKNWWIAKKISTIEGT
jgi:hypothetical protein